MLHTPDRSFRRIPGWLKIQKLIWQLVVKSLNKDKGMTGTNFKP